MTGGNGRFCIVKSCLECELYAGEGWLPPRGASAGWRREGQAPSGFPRWHVEVNGHERRENLMCACAMLGTESLRRAANQEQEKKGHVVAS